MRNWILFGLLFSFSSFCLAQDVKFSGSWSTGVPIGETSTLVNSTSGRGWQLDIDRYINDRWSIGGNMGWQSFFDKDYKMYLKDQSITSGIQRNYINAYWFSVGSKYYFSSTVNMVKAYLSINLGFSAIENWEIFGNNEYKEVLGHFTASPGLGVEIPATKNIGFLMYFKYQHSFKAQNSIHYSWLNTGIGMYFILASDD